MDSGNMSLQQLQVICLTFPLSPSAWIFLHSALFLSNFFLHLDLLFFFFLTTSFVPLLLQLYLFLVLLPSFLPLTPPPLSVLQGVGFSGSESCFALKNSLS